MRKTLLFVTLAFGSITVAGQNMPNIGWENWDSPGSYMEPTDWNSANQCSEGIGIQSVTRSTDAHTGMYSAKLETHHYLATIFVNGVVTTATMICDPFNPGQEGGYAEVMRPDSLTAWVKYAPQGNDNAYVQVIMFGSSPTDTIAYTKYDIMGTINEWTRISFPINWWSTASPSLASVLFNSSWGNGNEGQAVDGSILYVDDVNWAMFNSVPETEIGQWKVFPNPAIGELIVNRSASTAGKIEILDITGRSVLNEKLETEKTKIDLNTFPTGIYLYQLLTDKDEIVKTGKVLVNP